MNAGYLQLPTYSAALLVFRINYLASQPALMHDIEPEVRIWSRSFNFRCHTRSLIGWISRRQRLFFSQKIALVETLGLYSVKVANDARTIGVSACGAPRFRVWASSELIRPQPKPMDAFADCKVAAVRAEFGL